MKRTVDETQPPGRKGEIVEIHFLTDLQEENRRARNTKKSLLGVYKNEQHPQSRGRSRRP